MTNRHLRSERLRFLFRAGSAIASQGCLSVAHFVAGWLLLRAAGPEGYGHWVLAMGAITLLVSLQISFLGPALSLRMPALDPVGRKDLVGALLGEQRRLLCWCGALGGAGIALTVWLLPVSLNAPLLPVLVLAGMAAGLQLRREFLRQVLYTVNRPLAILGADLAYLLLLVGGILVARAMPGPWVMPAAVLALATAAGLAHALLAYRLERILAPVIHRRRGLSREMAPLAVWSTSGAALGWTTSQGFLYLVALQLGPIGVAAIAAVRLPMMPMNLLVSGLGGLLVPSAARWLASEGQAMLQRRVWAIATALGVVTGLWALALWAGRDPVLRWLSPEPLPHAVWLLAGWGVAYTLLAVRDTLAYIPAAAGRYRPLTLLTALTALVTAPACIVGMVWLPDGRGALLGVVIGEATALVGVIWLVSRASATGTGLTPAGTASPASA